MSEDCKLLIKGLREAIQKDAQINCHLQDEFNKGYSQANNCVLDCLNIFEVLYGDKNEKSN
jgi:hypothetical protein